MKNYIKVPFADKDAVKGLGAKWDMDMKSWYVPEDANKSTFSKWESHDPSVKAESAGTGTKIFLNVPFSEKEEVKSAGGRWDNDKKQWYYLSDKDKAPFVKWYSADQPAENKTQAKIGNKFPAKTPINNKSGNDDLDSDLDAILSLGDN